MLKTRYLLLSGVIISLCWGFKYLNVSPLETQQFALVAPTKWAKLLHPDVISPNWSDQATRCLAYGHQFRIRQSGDIRQAKLILNVESNIESVNLEIWRDNYNGTFSLIGESEVDLKQNNLLKPIINVKEGDYYALKIKGDISKIRLAGVKSKFSKTYCTNDTNSHHLRWLNQRQLEGFGLISYIYMDPPGLVGSGDSIMGGFPYHAGFLETTEKIDLQSPIVYWFGQKINVNYQNAGIGREPIYKISNRFDRDVINQHPKIVIVEGGVNDLDLRYSDYIHLHSWEKILFQTEHDSNIKKLIVLTILPWTNGDNQEMEKRDYWNKQLELISKYYSKVLLVNSDYELGQYREAGPAGNLWDIKPEYNRDGVHLNKSGYKKLATTIFQRLQQERIIEQSSFVQKNLQQLLDLDYQSHDLVVK